MKLAGLVIGIVMTLLAGITFVVCLALPTITDNHVSMQEAMLGIIPSAIVFFLAFLLTIISAIFVFKGRKKSAP
jgi:hypothetical protein